MNVVYDRKTDTLIVQLKSGPVAESDEEKPHPEGTRILDYDEEGNLVSFEILDASRRIPEVTRVDFKVTA